MKTSAGRTPQGDHVSTMLARARLRLTGAPENVLRQIPRFFALQLPAALYRLRWTDARHRRGLRRRRHGRRAVDLARPGARREPRQPAAARAVRRERVHRLLQRESRRRLRRHGVDEQRVDRRAVRAVRHHGLLADHGARAERGGRRHRRGRHVRVRPRRRLPALHPPARPARADLHLRRGRRRAAHLLGVGRPGSPAARRVARGRRDARSRRWRSASCSPSRVAGLIEGFVTAQPWPWPVKIGIGAAALALLPRLHARGRRPRATAAARPATSPSTRRARRRSSPADRGHARRGPVARRPGPFVAASQAVLRVPSNSAR